MRAIVQRRYGIRDVWTVGDLAVPEPARGQVLVQVGCAAIDRGTWHLMAGLPLVVRPVSGLRAPRHAVPGRDLAGRVTAVGPGVTRFAVGDDVFGTAASGSLAEYAVADENRLAHRPRSWSVAQAAATPVSGQTAWRAVHTAGRVRPGQTVLVLGASGGVGTFAVQIARAAGASVTAVCRTGSASLVLDLGADHVVDRTRVDLAELDRRFDVVLDIGGCPPVGLLRRLATPGGTVVLVGGERPEARWTGGFGRPVRAALLSGFVGQRLVLLAAREDHTTLARLVGLAERHVLHPVIDRVVPLDDAGSAVERLRDGRARGKLVIDVAGGPLACTNGVGTAEHRSESPA